MSSKVQEGIEDILLPASPPPDAINTLLPYAATLLLVIIVVWLLWRLMFSVRAVSIRHLKHNTDSLVLQEDYNAVIYHVAKCLRRRLKVNRLDHRVSLPSSLQPYQQRWYDFLDDMQESRYASCNHSRNHTLSLLSEAEFWLRKWP